MRALSIAFLISTALLGLSLSIPASPDRLLNSGGVFIVYMGAATTSGNDYANQLITTLSDRKGALVHTYRKGFSGFAAKLTKKEAESLRKRPGVVSVFPDPVFKLHTTRSWDFLRSQLTTNSGDDECTRTPSNSSLGCKQGTDTIIGFLDTGIWPESKSFVDEGFGPIPSKWKGTCMKGQDFTSSHCNRKVIGARYYIDPYDDEGDSSNYTPRDMSGHGTHVASTAAGTLVPGASYYGFANGTARGGSPGSRIAVYRVCTEYGCRGSAILAGFDDAIADGVDVISLSIGGPAFEPLELSTDPIAIGAFHAVEKGILVICSGGNEGPEPQSVVNIAPWIFTVAATTVDRNFETNLLLGNKRTIKGGGIHFGDIQKNAVYPLIYGKDASYPNGDYDTSNCDPYTLDEQKVKGKIVVCENESDGYTVQEKVHWLKTKSVAGIVLIDDSIRVIGSTYGSLPVSVITYNKAYELHSYFNSTRKPVATILPTTLELNYKPAPVIADFSSRGPAAGLRQILKPDIAAPGVDILAACPNISKSEALEGGDPPLFCLRSGTSMSAPHVSGIAATVKSRFPSWSPSAIKSAMMTTAMQINNMKLPTTTADSIATAYDYGAGEVTTTGPLQPGLVYETTTNDYLKFLCKLGYNLSTIKLISSMVPVGFTCPQNHHPALISNMNYPSIVVYANNRREITNVTRTVKNVDDRVAVTTYTATVAAPSGLEVTVTPDKLQFTKTKRKLSYRVMFAASVEETNDEVLFGSITWSNGKYKVRTPFVFSSVTDGVGSRY